MMENVAGRDTVAIEDTVHEIYKQLTEGNDPVNVPFRTMKDLFMWAACMGYRQGKRRSLTGKRQIIFRWAQFSSQVDVPLLKAIAIADKAEVNVLLNQEEILSIVEEYANAGIYDLRDAVVDQFGQPLWNLVSIVSEL